MILSVVNSGNPAQPLLYAYDPKIASSSPAKNGGQTHTYTHAANDLYVSTNGGATWLQAPTRGVPAQQGVDAPIVGVLNDGTVISTFAPQSSDSSGDYTSSFYGWKLGETSWREITPPLKKAGGVVSLTVAQGTHGTEMLLAVTDFTFRPYNEDTFTTSYITHSR